MADKNIEIGITTTADTSGAKQAEAAVRSMEAEVSRSSNTIEQAAQGPIKRHAEKTKEASTQTKNWGMAANAMSFQMQDFSVQVGSGTSAVTAFAQQAPQLIDGLRMAGVLTGGVGMAMMGVSAVLPVAMFGAKALWSNFNSGAIDAKKHTEALFDKLKDASKVYQEFEEIAAKDRGKTYAEDQSRLNDANAESRTKARIATDAAAIQGTVATLQAQLELARERISLARTEAALQEASGSDVLKYSRQREESILRIYDTELKIAQIARDTAMNNARASVEEASRKFQDEKDSKSRFYSDLDAQRRKVDELKKEYLDLAALWKNYNDEISAKKEELKKFPSAVDPRTQQGEAIMRERADLALKERAKTKTEDDMVRIQSQLGPAQKTLESMEKDSAEIKKTINDAAAKVTEAMAVLTGLRKEDEAQKTLGSRIKATSATDTADKEITGAAKSAIGIAGGAPPKKPQDGFPGFEDATGFSGRAGAKAIAGELNTLITDNTPDSKQAPQILQLIDSLKTALGGKDAAIASSLDKLASSVKAATDRIKEIESKLDNSR